MAQRFLIHYPQYTITVESNCPQALELCKSCQEALWIIKNMSIFVHRALADTKLPIKIYRLTFQLKAKIIHFKFFLNDILVERFYINFSCDPLWILRILMIMKFRKGSEMLKNGYGQGYRKPTSRGRGNPMGTEF